MYACRHENEVMDEFERLLTEVWRDRIFLEIFFEENKNDLNLKYHPTTDVEKAVELTIQFAKQMRDSFLSFEQKDRLNELFRNLDEEKVRIKNLDKSKSKRSWLRLYAIKIDENMFLITGGAIKLTLKMEERTHTQRELDKLSKCQAFLQEQGIIDKDGFMEFNFDLNI